MLRFLLKASQPIFVHGVINRQELKRNLAVECPVFSKIDLAHSASANQPVDLVMSNVLVRYELRTIICDKGSCQFQGWFFNEVPFLSIRHQHRFDSCPQGLITFTSAVEKSRLPFSLQLNGGLKQLIYLLPRFMIHFCKGVFSVKTVLMC